MRRFSLSLLGCLAACAVSGFAQAQVHRCTVDGRTVVQDRPCADAVVERPQRPVVVIPRPVDGPPIGDPAYEREKEAQRRKDLEEFGKRAGKRVGEDKAALRARCGEVGEAEPYIGASAEWVRTCSTWGEPSRVNTTANANGAIQQWVYRHRGYLYFDHQQRLVTIQN